MNKQCIASGESEREGKRENRKHTGQNGDIERIKESESERGI